MSRPRLPEGERDANRRAYLDRTREQRQAQQREYRRQNPELSRDWREQNPERFGPRQPRDRRARMRRHGPGIEAWIAEALRVQDGRCYLCIDPLPDDQGVIDHDHTCCPEARTCSACRRGLACQRCNRLIGQVGDDPALLRRIADALEAALESARARIAATPDQLGLLEGEL